MTITSILDHDKHEFFYFLLVFVAIEKKHIKTQKRFSSNFLRPPGFFQTLFLEFGNVRNETIF